MNMQKRNADAIIFSILVIAGFSLSVNFYHESVHPLELAVSHLKEITASSDPKTIREHISAMNYHVDKIWDTLPESKNPVWIYPTESTNFARIQSDVDSIVVSLDKISAVPRDSSAYHTGMMDINERTRHIQENISDAMPYMYGTLSVAFFNSILLVGLMGLIERITGKPY
ncbi:MAG: hypothetical protein K5798_10045 [Nitrosopumilus sp.]|uniref:hypothetical protein n=1 Tax=Nitrosopumilus sp. TaxID=2024843 RepID=UPI0024327475|nr:hypothetical protein [Nitrosopumilus sp.]MCV0367585.1 hypothetical protein [Nitrosopumilus sp.]